MGVAERRLARAVPAALAAVATVAALASGGASAAPSRGPARLVRMAKIIAPTYVTAPPADTHRVFVTQQAGTIRVLRDGKLLPQPFLDLSDRVVHYSEQGLTSMAFAPDYARTGRFYVFYTAPRPGDADHGSILTLSEFRRSASDPDRADPASERVVLTIDHPNSPEHNAGQLHFDARGRLWISTGDGGSGDTIDAHGNARNLGSLLGKILRIDPRPSDGHAYGVPPANPFVGKPGDRGEVVEYGFRNPWRFSFDRSTGDLLIGDVGQAHWEEVDLVPSGDPLGDDFGWPCREGRVHTPGLKPPCDPGPSYRPPIAVYPHADHLCAIDGGYVVRDPGLPSLFGRYLYGDLCDHHLRWLVPRTPNAADSGPAPIAAEEVDALGEDACGHVWVASMTDAVYRVAGERSKPCWQITDRRRPRLQLGGRTTQALRRVVRVHARCDERCGVAVTGRLSIPGAARRHLLVEVSRVAAGGAGMRLRVPIPQGARNAARAALGQGRTVKAVLRLVANDAAGNRRTRHLVVRLTE